MKPFLIIFGISLAVLGTLILPAVAGGVSIGALISGRVGVFAVAGFLLAGGLACLLGGGILIGKGDGSPPEACPACKAVTYGAWVCPACAHDFAPPRFGLDTASLVGGIAALVFMGGAVGLVFAQVDQRLVAAAFLSALCGGGLAVLMAVCSLIAGKRRPGLAVAGLIMAIIAVGSGVTLIVI